MKVAVEHLFTGATSGVAAYNSAVTTIGTLFQQYSGVSPSDRYVSTKPSAMANILETANSSYYMPHVYKWSENIYWIFVATNAAVAATRTLGLFEFNVSAGTLTWKGFITLSGTTIAGNKLIRGLRGFVYKHTTGTVSTAGSSTTITGNGTGFQTEGIAVGARIGFGSTDPTAITTWHEISAIASDTSLTISAAADLSAGTPYVIEEIRLLVACTNVTLTNGGPHLIKGLNYGTFQPGGTTIPEASTVDNIRASYLLKDAATTTMTVAMGLASDDFVSHTEQHVYFLNLDVALTVRIHKLNIRAALTVSGGTSTSAWVFKTGQQTVAGTASQNNNGRLFTVGHLSASGVKSVWFTTTTKVYRCDVAAITDGSVSWLSDSMNELPPGGANITHLLTNTLNQVDYSSTLDRIIVPTTSARVGVYIGQYDTSNTQLFDKIFGSVSNRYKLSTTAAGATNALFPSAALTTWTEEGWMFAIPSVVTTGLNWIFIFPFAADGMYADNTNQYIITPKMSTLNATKLYRCYVDRFEYVGSYELGYQTEAIRIYFRTSGIDDNTGPWTEVPVGGDLTGHSASTDIQFKIKVDTLGELCVPARLHSIACVYEDGSQDSHYQPSLTKSSAASRILAWRQVLPWGTNIPNLQIRLYNADTAFLVLDDNITDSLSGTFEYSTDGIAWNAWSASADTVGNYIRYTATTLPNNITVRALLTQA